MVVRQTAAEKKFNLELERLLWEWYDNIVQSAWTSEDLEELNELMMYRGELFSIKVPESRLQKKKPGG